MVRRRWRSWIIFLSCIGVGFLCFGWKQELDKEFLELDTCPACYGQTLCHDFPLLGKHRNKASFIELDFYSGLKPTKLVNVKNVYYAKWGHNFIVLKKLAHDSELKEFDQTLCDAARTLNCNVSEALVKLMNESRMSMGRIVKDEAIYTEKGTGINSRTVVEVIRKFPKLFQKSEVLQCGQNSSIEYLFSKFSMLHKGQDVIPSFLTLLAVNPEPIIIMSFQSSYGGFLPMLYGTCGRIIAEEYVGVTLAHLITAQWIIRARYALQLLTMARDFSQGRFRLYMTDVSTDNFAVDASGNVKIIDVENILMVDSEDKALDQKESINDGFACRRCFSFSYEDVCTHLYADHNYFAVCKHLLMTFLKASFTLLHHGCIRNTGNSRTS
ncbi:divergent protein kinase domain 2A isoform X2 [Oratosquilla oratoria]|uniref:divergent protein kinase domain 2A isoform X2 n=1 Tax=Oratosquilla oratoria TaxID=337810 RepID=UPI003F7748FC